MKFGQNQQQNGRLCENNIILLLPRVSPFEILRK